MLNLSPNDLPNALKKYKKTIVWISIFITLIFCATNMYKEFRYIKSTFNSPSQPIPQPTLTQKGNEPSAKVDTSKAIIAMQLEIDSILVNQDEAQVEEISRDTFEIDSNNVATITPISNERNDEKESTLRQTKVKEIDSFLTNGDPKKRCIGFNKLWRYIMENRDVRLFEKFAYHAELQVNRKLTMKKK